MTDGDALLAAICAHPFDDTPRLAYADWLQEQGGRENLDRAEFIRLQIELHNSLGSDDPSPPRKLKRAHTLQKRYGKRWSAPLIGKGGPLFGEHTFTNFDRGFVDRVGGTAENWITGGDEVFRRAPVTNASVDELLHDTLVRILASDWAKKLHTFEMSSPFEDGEDWLDDGDPPQFGAFAAASLPNLKFLWFSAGELSVAGAGRVAAADPMPNLETLQLSEVPLTPQSTAKLFGRKAFASVRELYLGECGVDAGVLAALAKCKSLANVEELALPYQTIDDDGLIALTRAAFWPTVRRVEFSTGRLTARSMRAMGERPGGPRELELRRCDMSAAAAKALAAGDALRGVTSLELQWNPIGDAGVIALTRCPHLAGMKALSLEGVGMGTAGAKAELAECPAVAGLESLDVDENDSIEPAGFVALAKSPHLGNLKRFYVGSVKGKARKQLTERFGDRVRF